MGSKHTIAFEPSPVAFVQIKERKVGEVQKQVQRAMDLMSWRDEITGEAMFLKVNLFSKEVVPGQCTSPWVFEGVLEQIREQYPKAKVFWGDCDVSTANQLNDAVKNWGFDRIAKCYDARFINLSKTEGTRESFGGIFKDILVPRILLEVTDIITIPVIKTHCITPFTGALKNQWGFFPRIRFKFHPMVHRAIAEINAFFPNLKLGVADLTVAMEGPGPRVGTPKICDAVMASRDLVALDAAVAEYMGLDPNQVGFLDCCQEKGIGSKRYRIAGDPFAPNPFKPGKGKDYLIYRWRDRIKEIPLLGRLILENAFPFRFLGFWAVLYYRYFWYSRYGRAYARSVCQDSLYVREFKELIAP